MVTDGPPHSFSIHPDLLLSVLDDATVLVDNRGRARLTNPRMDRLFASDEGKRLLPFVAEDGAYRLGSAGQYASPLREVVLGIEDVLAGARERLELDLGEPGASLYAIACAVDGARGALIRARLRTAEEEHRARAVESIEAMQLGLNIFHLDDPNDERSLRCLYANPASARISGTPTSALIGRRLDDVTPVAGEQGLLAKYREAALEKKTMDLELFAHREDGTLSTFEVKAFPLAGQCMGALFEDVTERRKTMQQLRETSQFLDTILDNIPMFIFIKEAKGLKYIHTNRYLLNAMKDRASVWVGKTDSDLFPKEIADLFVAKDREVFEKRVIVDIPQEEVPINGGELRICHTRKIPLYDENGEPLYLIGLSEDITERKVAEDARRRELVLLETQEQLMELVRQLSTPLLPLSAGVLVAPLIGQMDERRGEHFLSSLLSGIERFQARVVLIDITGVPSMDASVAEQLMRATKAARLLGTETALVGVGPDVAKTLVELGVDFTGLVTYADLRAGMRAVSQKNAQSRAKKTI